MTNGVHYVPLGIDLNLDLPNLGHADQLGLRERILTETSSYGLYQCIQYGREGICNSSTSPWMYLKGRDRDQLSAAHYPRSADPTDGTPESDLHKALKERTVNVAEREGLTTKVEQDLSTPTGTYRPDVLVQAADGATIAFEAQVSYATTANILRRTARARSLDIAPLWTTHDPMAGWIGRAPWQRIFAPDWKAVLGIPDIIAQGLRGLAIEECGRRGPCPHLAARQPCPGRHAFWDVRQATFDRLVVAMANKWVIGAPIDGNWWLITAADRDRYLNLGGTLVDHRPVHTSVFHAADPRPIEAACQFGVETETRPAPRPRLGHNRPIPAALPDQRNPGGIPVAGPPPVYCCGRDPGRAQGDLVAPACQLCPNSPTYWRAV